MPIRPRCGKAARRPPEEIVLQFLGTRVLEAVNLASLRIDARHDVFDRAVFAGGVHGLEDEEKGVTIVRVEQTLQLPELLDLVREHLAVMRLRFVERLRCRRAFAQPQRPPRGNAKFFEVQFHDAGN